MITATIEVKVNLEPAADEPSGYRFVNIKVGDEPSIPILQDKPVPRRFVQSMVEAAKKQLGKDTEEKRAARAKQDAGTGDAGAAQVSTANPPQGPMPNAPDETPDAIMTPGPYPNKHNS